MIHAEVLPDEQVACLRGLAPAAMSLGLYLAGGTAVALHVGHRRSVDFDWFAPRFPGQRLGDRPPGSHGQRALLHLHGDDDKVVPLGPAR